MDIEMIEIHLLGEMLPLQIKATREAYDEIILRTQCGNFVHVDNFLINFNRVTYMEYVEE